MPADTAELFEALEALLKAERELRKQKRALFPAVLARRRATSRVLEIWRAMKGEPSDPSRPIIDAIDRRAAAAPVVVEEAPETEVLEELPDGSRARPVVSHVPRPPQGWSVDTLRHAAEEILGTKFDSEQQADLLVCSKEWCGALRYQPHAERDESRCPVCKGRKFRAYLDAMIEIQAEDLFARRLERAEATKGSMPSSNGHAQPPAPTKPYAYEIRIRRSNGTEEDIVRVARSEGEAKRKGLMRPLAESAEIIGTMSREQYVRAYGDPKVRT